MQTIDQFLHAAKSISIGSVEINMASPSKLDKMQVGYSRDPKGKSLITGNEGDWRQEWLVVGWNELGDPIFIDVSSSGLEVFSAMHGEGSWEPFKIADSIDKFSEILNRLSVLSKGRKHSVGLEKNPMSAQEAEDFLTFVHENNPDSDMGFWNAMIRVCLD
jgi:hypothetical protein